MVFHQCVSLCDIGDELLEEMLCHRTSTGHCFLSVCILLCIFKRCLVTNDLPQSAHGCNCPSCYVFECVSCLCLFSTLESLYRRLHMSHLCGLPSECTDSCLFNLYLQLNALLQISHSCRFAFSVRTKCFSSLCLFNP